ncbi:hypothetical protein BKA62DRAFT_80167 [Auriculariales sp. MPI-PUGE-AT-0066]|nr:hypothetical protein BKA62DRAFT_80167 [Auriculariales sp. MPI-PUGE-AT-0066]
MRSSRRSRIRKLPGLDKNMSKEELRSRISAISATCQGCKAVIGGIVDKTVRLPWPTNAVPQTLLRILKNVETTSASRERITEVIEKVGSLWVLVTKFDQPGGRNQQLHEQVQRFFKTIYCIFIRLELFQSINPVRGYITGFDDIGMVIENEVNNLSAAKQILQAAYGMATSNSVMGRRGSGPDSGHFEWFGLTATRSVCFSYVPTTTTAC